jgi:vacuolar-type H+-ATPase subunit F/Vma7
MRCGRCSRQRTWASLLVTRDLWDGLPERARQAIERLAQPIVLAVPAGEISEPAARRALLGEMLERAIGYRIELGGEQP